ncbi:MAG: PAS-domain containing protein, partial [Pseudomonadota bacterium]
MSLTLVSSEDTAERKVEKLLKISDALMRRVEQAADDGGAAYAHFQRAVVLERQVRDRTRDLERTLTLLNESNARLAAANEAEQQARAALSNALEAVREGFALFGPDDRMVMFNSRFCRQLPDVWARLGEGMTFDDYVALVAGSAHLDRREGPDAADWAERRRALHHEDHAMFNVRVVGDVWLQVSEHRTPDGGTAIIQTDITDMIRLERAERDEMLGAQERMVRATLDHINQGVAIFDAGARLVGWNRRLGALLSPPMQLVRVGAPFALLFDHVERGAVFSGGVSADDLRAWTARRGGGRPAITLDMARSGAVLSVHAQETPDGGFVVSFADVTAERRAAAALSEANETLERRVRERTEELRDALSEAERANAS